MTYKLKEFNSTQQRVCDSFKIRNECLLNKELELHVFVISGHHISNEVPEKKKKIVRFVIVILLLKKVVYQLLPLQESGEEERI